MKHFIFFILISLLFTNSSYSQFYINEVFIDRKNVYEESDPNWFFLSPTLNRLHFKTNLSVIRNEILFFPNGQLLPDYLDETERNLRRTGLFSEVRIEIDSVDYENYDIYVITKDRWSTVLAPFYDYNGSETIYGGLFKESNLFGTGNLIELKLVNKTEHEIKWQAEAIANWNRIFGSFVNARYSLQSHQFRTEHHLDIFQPFHTQDTRLSFGVNAKSIQGYDFIITNRDSVERLRSNEQTVDFFLSRSWWREDRIFITLSGGLQEAFRHDSSLIRAYDNTGNLMISFSSVSQNYRVVSGLNNYFDEDIAIGGYGNATLGRVFSLGAGGETLYYVGGEGETSYYTGDLYLFARLLSSTSFDEGAARYTYQEFLGRGFYRLSDKIVFGANIRQQTAWNWTKDRQLVLDADAGLRGYDANRFAGDNRIVGNFEMRWMPRYNVKFFDISAVGFYDIGTVWDTDVEIFKAQFKHSLGAGLRFHFAQGSMQGHNFRLDFAYNLERNQPSIIFTTGQLFSLFFNHKYKRPRIFGLEFDRE